MIDLDYNTIVNLYCLEDPPWSAYDIAKYYKCSSPTIYRFIHKNNIPIRSSSEALIVRWKCIPKRKQLIEDLKKRKGWTDKRRKEMSKRMRKLYSDPMEREKQAERMIKYNKSLNH